MKTQETGVLFCLPDHPTDSEIDTIIDEARIMGEVTYQWLGKIATLTIEQIEDEVPESI